jgi:hypothetical protein
MATPYHKWDESAVQTLPLLQYYAKQEVPLSLKSELAQLSASIDSKCTDLFKYE